MYRAGYRNLKQKKLFRTCVVLKYFSQLVLFLDESK